MYENLSPKNFENCPIWLHGKGRLFNPMLFNLLLCFIHTNIFLTESPFMIYLHLDPFRLAPIDSDSRLLRRRKRRFRGVVPRFRRQIRLSL